MEVKATQGEKLDYLAMILIFKDGKVIIDMRYYIKRMLEEFPAELMGGVNCPWTEQLFKVDNDAKPLNSEHSKTFHTFVMKGMFLSKQARQDIHPAIVFLSTRVKSPTDQDWKKLL